MMEKEVIKIASPNQYIASTCLDIKKKKVAAYARVSTDSDDQIHSFKSQIDEYTKKITSNPNWEFVGMYSDEGITGTSLKCRDGFNAMVKEAKAGGIDLILVKSVSRFGRNTVDLLSTIRELRNIGVEIIFEKEGISSLDTKTDMILTFHSSIAQEESKNISDNVKWAIKKKMKEGNWSISTAKFLGYGKDENGNLIIDEEQAEVVRAIFNLYLANKSIKEIIDFLEGCHYLTGSGKEKWNRQNIMQILQNEKYKGDLILQKTVVIDYLSHESKSNKDGKYADMWLVKNHHPAIISREAFDLVQNIITHKKEDRFARPNIGGPLSSKLYCGNCGKPLIYQSRPGNKDTYVCNVNRRVINDYRCSNTPIRVDDINAICIKAIKEYYSDKSLTSSLIKTLTNLGASSTKQEEYNKVKEEINELEASLKAIIERKMEFDLEDDDEKLSLEYKVKKKELNNLKAKLDELSVETYESFINENRSKEIINAINNDVNDECYLKLIDEVIVNEDKSITIIDNFGTPISKDEISKNVKELNKLKEVLRGYYSSPNTGKVYKYKIVRLEGICYKK